MEVDNKEKIVFLLNGEIDIEIKPIDGIFGFSIVKFKNKNDCERVKSFLIHKFGKEFISGQADKYFYIPKKSLTEADLDAKEFLKFEGKFVDENQSRLPSKLENYDNPNSPLEKGIAKGDLSLGDSRYLANGRRKKMRSRNKRINNDDETIIIIETRKHITNWEEFFSERGYCVSVRTKKDLQGKFLFHSLYFLSNLEKINAMKEKSFFVRYKFQPCEGQNRKFKSNSYKRRFKVFREYPDPE